MINRITSRDNKILKMVRSLLRKKGRGQTGLYFAEGKRLVDEAIRYIPHSIRHIIVSEEYVSENTEYLDGLASSNVLVYVTENKIFTELCDTQTPQGIMAVIEIPTEASADFSSLQYVLILDGVSEPGNLGTIIRTAEAAGIQHICLTNGCVDIYNPKTVRASMGSVFRMKFLHTDKTFIEQLKSVGFTIVATALYNSIPIEEAKFSGKRAIVIGNEAKGVSKEVLGISDISVKIDMSGKVESLNAAVAAGITMYMLRPEQRD